MGYSAFDNLPPKFSDLLNRSRLLQLAAEKTETNIWSGGVNANAGEFDGFTTVIERADADVIDVAAWCCNCC